MPYPDFEEFIAALNANGARYLIVGAHALAHHARPRATKDLDILIDRTDANARRVVRALTEFFGTTSAGIRMEDLTQTGWHVQLGVAPVRIDILTGLPGCPSFGTMWKQRVRARFGNEPANFLSLRHLIEAKEAAGRPQDLADLDVLKRVGRRRRS